MSEITVIWSMVAAACLTLAGVYLPVWLRNRAAWPSFFFSVLAVATATAAFGELWMMRAQTPDEFAAALRWQHLYIWFVIVSLVGFVYTFFTPGRLWLAWSVVVLRTLSLVLNFSTGQNLNFSVVTAVQRMPFLGEPVSTAIGIPNPWMAVGSLSAILLVIFVADAAIRAWRRGNRGAALRVGGMSMFFALAGIVQVMLVVWGGLQMPITISMFSLGVLVAMGHELSRDVVRASELVAELRESEQRMTLAAEVANLGIWVRDLPRDEFWASPRLRELFGFDAAEPVDLERLLLKVHTDDREAVRQVLAQAMAGDGDYETEFRAVLPDGTLRWIATRGRVDFDTNNRAVRTRGACGDITPRRQAEDEMLRLRQEIAHAGRVSVMGQLSSALAHEINQPLGAILRNAEAATLLLQVIPPDLDEVRAIVDDIISDDQRAGAVIDRMRALLRRQDIVMVPLAVDELVGDVAALVRPDAAARQVRMDVEIADDVPRVLGDRVHLQQVLLNLISNGMDSIDEARRNVRHIVVSAVRDGAQTVQITVSDSGAGIPNDRLEQVFGSFFTTKPAGMGMGLSISRSLIETHGGRLWAENRAGGGASLRFTLPVSSGISAT
ncbi:sensor histidine kinase [Roseateles sp.]|uniref:sensor histidine kinase n=1 Tax=Roseateles sp. TaxID=1971397 RepID=UPI00286A6F3C|nr:ATP-binding protein [Roseateles sp.]